ncbi:MAG: hypothetical protein U5L76_01255 [Patescibacteria group bacterium]|nr:hypothetical protein [Patescibacteria group bacterium]
MKTKLKIGIIALSIIVIVSGGWVILNNTQEEYTTVNYNSNTQEESTRGKYDDNIYYCVNDDDCKMWWGPDHCGCGNKYYEYPEEIRNRRPSLVCEGDPSYECKCIENKCQ